jgi:hypothetical protein
MTADGEARCRVSSDRDSEVLVAPDMPARLHSFSGARLSLIVMFVTLATARPEAHAQHVSGALGVAATILPAIPSQAARVVTFDVGRGGTVRLETTAPSVGVVSQIVMYTVSSSANAAGRVEPTPMLVEGASRPGSPDRVPSRRETRDARMRVDLRLGDATDASPDSSGRDVSVRISYLVVPGT